MSSDLSEQLDSLTLNDDNRVRLSAASTNSTGRRSYGTAGHQRRQHLHSKRSATIDPETIDERLRIVVLGATKVGESSLLMHFLPILILNN